MKTDHLLYRIFQEFPASFFELIGKSATDAVAYRFDSVELKQTSFRLDGLWTPIKSCSKLPAYFGEVQFQKNPKFYSNLFSKVFLYLQKTDPELDWIAVAIFAKRSMEPDNLKPYQELLNSPKVIRIYLDELAKKKTTSLGISIIQLVLAKAEEAEEIAEKAVKLLERAKQEVADQQTQLKVLDLIETIVVYKLPDKTRQERQDLEAMLGLEDLRKTKFAQEMLIEGREQGLELGLERGLERGLELGLEQGKLQAKLETVPELLKRGFTVEQVAEILKLEVEQVSKLAKEQE
ncbi:MAG: Rpn family recombination-promoting nuclease/putative transposase [Oscillatoria sp. SIO1A7]|nr:Rpn family recombination-promoting nuclease/putative transposase [Oscillatoria sp. SIO1A7]